MGLIAEALVVFDGGGYNGFDSGEFGGFDGGG